MPAFLFMAKLRDKAWFVMLLTQQLQGAAQRLHSSAHCSCTCGYGTLPSMYRPDRCEHLCHPTNEFWAWVSRFRPLLFLQHYMTQPKLLVSRLESMASALHRRSCNDCRENCFKLWRPLPANKTAWSLDLISLLISCSSC